MPEVFTVAARKGGVGKTTIAIELAACLGGVLVDLDFDGGGATGILATTRPTRSRLLDAIEAGEGPPRPLRARHRPDLVPAHPVLGDARVEPDVLADALVAWSDEWGRPVVIDTHPGYGPLAAGAMLAARVVVVPVMLARAELLAFAGMREELAGYPLMIVPNMVPPRPPRLLVERLAELADGRPVGSPIGMHAILRRRMRRSAVCLDPAPGQALRRAAEEFRIVAREVEAACLTASRS